MKKEKFNEIYNNAIIKLKNELDPDNITKLKFSSYNKLFSKYQFSREYIKKYYMENPNENIDRHKIAACMMYSIIDIYPCYVPLSEKIKMLCSKKRFSLEIAYINEYIAIYTALSILDNFYEQDKKEGKLDARRHKIYIPETFSDDYGYIFNMCVDLRFAKMRNKMNILTYSNILFLLEYQHPFNNTEHNT